MAGIPFTIIAGWMVRKIGHVPILVIGLVTYMARFMLYSFSTTAVHVLAIELLEGVTTFLMIVTITTYSRLLSTEDLVATTQATWAALHFSAGRAIGSATGGYMMER